METNFRIEVRHDNILIQNFNGKEYRLYPKERYFKSHRYYMHHDVWKYFNGQIPKGYHVHHKDGSSWNNNIQNLELIEANKHLSFHSKQRLINNPDHKKRFIENGIIAAKEWHKSNEGLQWHKEHAKRCNFGHFDYGTDQCIVCGKDYKRRTKHAKFCHPNCKAKHLRQRRKLERESLRSDS